MATNKIEELVFSFLDMIGIQRKEVQPGIWVAKIPDRERSFFNGFEILKFTFDRQTAQDHRDLAYICDGSYLLRKIIERLAEIPKASRLFSLAQPEMPPADKSGKLRVIKSDDVYYRQQIVFNFKVQFECDQRREKLYSISADPSLDELDLVEGMRSFNVEEFSEEPQSGIRLEESGLDCLRVYLQSCQKLENFIKDEMTELEQWGESQCSEQLKKFEDYLDEQTQELLKKKENVCFHLYFFQKEEEIDKLIENLERERNRKLSELRDKFSLTVSINLINAVVLCIPTVAASPVKNRRSVAKGEKATLSKNAQGLRAQMAW